MTLLVVGTLAFDSVETPFGRRDDALGGSANFLATSAAYFTRVRMVGVIGDDFPNAQIEFFKSRGIDLEGVERQAGKTFRWRGKYTNDLNVAHTLETQLNVLQSFTAKVPERFCDTPFAVLGNFDPALQRRVLEQLHGPKLVACDTMNFWISGMNAELRQTLGKVHLLSVNDGEARMLSGEHNLVKAARAIFDMGPRIVVIKRGEHGALVFSDDGIFAAPAYPLETIKDPTGAGDSFAGGMMGFLAARGKLDHVTLRQAVIMGSVMASYAVEDFSMDRFRTLTRQDILGRYDAFRRLTSFEVDATWDMP